VAFFVVNIAISVENGESERHRKTRIERFSGDFAVMDESIFNGIVYIIRGKFF